MILSDPRERQNHRVEQGVCLVDPSLVPEKATQFEEMESLACAHQLLTQEALQRSLAATDPETLRELRILGYLE